MRSRLALSEESHANSLQTAGKKLTPNVISYLFLQRRLQGGCGRLVPPGQWGAEPLHFAQVNEEGAVGAVHTVEGITRVGGPASTHPLEGRETGNWSLTVSQHQICKKGIKRWSQATD